MKASNLRSRHLELTVSLKHEHPLITIFPPFLKKVSHKLYSKRMLMLRLKKVNYKRISTLFTLLNMKVTLQMVKKKYSRKTLKRCLTKQFL